MNQIVFECYIFQCFMYDYLYLINRKGKSYVCHIAKWLDNLQWERLSVRGKVPELYRQSNGQMNWSIDHWNVCTTLVQKTETEALAKITKDDLTEYENL